MLGSKWVVNFTPEPDLKFYGLGEKSQGFEKTGTRTKFWNTDGWADFHPAAKTEGVTDPMYISVPYVLVKAEHGWVGILVNNPFPVFMHLMPDDTIAGGLHGALTPARRFCLGSSGGGPEIYLILGSSARDVTTRLQRLTGTVPLPPLWALGYHQSRWGYKSFADLDRLDRKFIEEKIPCDGLWLDIDYMDGFRIFSIDEKGFSHPSNQFQDLKRRGRRVVPILDPGIKADPDFDVYRDALKKNILCKTSEGLPFVGLVWPGETVFPDFSLAEAREWWAEQVRKLASNGIHGFWLDMNDPSTGAVDPSDMLFGGGRIPHEEYHNQYALGMQEASWDGLIRAHSAVRPFLVSRSAFISSSRYGAVWTGDNWSNRLHLRRCIPVCLNLSLSGLPFCGPDVPGFGGDADGPLAAAWFKTCFLFPFLRNHSVAGSREQEPWSFGAKTRDVLARYIRLRYKLMPYLYNLFIDQEERGEPILRPLFYHFDETPGVPLSGVADQFMVGPSILQAPLLEEKSDSRTVVLPGEGLRWFSAADGRWIDGGRIVQAGESAVSTPLFIREGAVIPMQEGVRENPDKTLAFVEFHVFLPADSQAEAEYVYSFDDGESFAYRKGFRTSFRLTAKTRDKTLRVEIRDKKPGHLPCELSFVLYGAFDKVVLLDGAKEAHLPTAKSSWDFLGRKVGIGRTREFLLK